MEQGGLVGRNKRPIREHPKRRVGAHRSSHLTHGDGSRGTVSCGGGVDGGHGPWGHLLLRLRAAEGAAQGRV